VVILEAQAAGLPGVATRHAGIADAVIHGHTGYLVEERDVSGMAERMLELVTRPDICRPLGANAREHSRSHSSMTRHIACLQQVVDEARAMRASA